MSREDAELAFGAEGHEGPLEGGPLSHGGGGLSKPTTRLADMTDGPLGAIQWARSDVGPSPGSRTGTKREPSARDQRGADSSAAAAICSGLIGVELNSILNGASASDTALAMTTGGEMALPSPTPLTPSGLSGEGEC